MSDTITIRTPEAIEVKYNLAGYGSRLMAGLLDYFIVAALMVTTSLVVLLLTALLDWLGGDLIKFIGPFIAAIYIIVNFLIFWGYFIFFEMVWNGQTPGKRILRLRTISEGGFELKFFPSVARNLVRMADMFPLFYLVGFMAMVLNKRRKRLGDFVAGTLVIREQDLVPPQAWAMDQGRYNSFREDRGLVQRIAAQISHQEFEVLKDLYLRRDQISMELRNKLDHDIYNFLSAKLDLPPNPLLSEEQIIRNVLEIRQKEE